MSNLAYRPVYEIAAEVNRLWRDQNGYRTVAQEAKPYLRAMATIDTIDDRVELAEGDVGAEEVVQGFLDHARTFRGPDARRIKRELLAMLAGRPVPTNGEDR